MKFLAFFTVLVFSVQAFSLVITDERGKIDITLPNGWNYEKNILGLPHVFLTADKPERSSISLTLTGIQGVNLPVKDLKKNQAQYQAGRKRWAQKRDATIEKFYPYEVSSLSDGHQVHKIGMEYKINKQSHIEKSFYIECPKSFVHLKLVSPSSNIARLKEADEMIKSLKCDA